MTVALAAPVELEVGDAASAAAALAALVVPVEHPAAPGTDRLLAASIGVVSTFHALAADPQLGLDPRTFRHVSQRLVVHPDAPLDRLAVQGEVVARARLGQQQGLDVRVTVVDAATRAPVAEGRSLVQAASPHPDTADSLARDERRDTVQEVVAARTWWAGPDVVARYAALTGDASPLHVDPDAAWAAGLDAPILPGLFVLAAAAALAACAPSVGLRTVTGLAGRFTRPVPVGAPVDLVAHRATSGEPASGAGATRVAGLDAAVHGARVLRNAWIAGT